MPTFLLALAGTFLNAYGQFSAGQQAQDVANRNAQIAEQQAISAQNKAALDEAQQRKQAYKLKGAQRARIAKTGATQGSFEGILRETVSELELDALAIRYGGELAFSQKMSEAESLRFGGKQASRAGIIGAGSTLLTGLGSLQSPKTTTSPNSIALNRTVPSGSFLRDL